MLYPNPSHTAGIEFDSMNIIPTCSSGVPMLMDTTFHQSAAESMASLQQVMAMHQHPYTGWPFVCFVTEIQLLMIVIKTPSHRFWTLSSDDPFVNAKCCSLGASTTSSTAAGARVNCNKSTAAGINDIQRTHIDVPIIGWWSFGRWFF